MRAIVIDDHSPSATAVARLLEHCGCEPQICTDSPRCVERAIEGDVDLVTLDLGMPGLDGFEVLSLIRSHEQSRQRPGVQVVAVTGHVSAADRARTISAGCVAHVGKPVEQAALGRALDRVRLLRGDLPRACATADAAAVRQWMNGAVEAAGGERVRVVAGLALVVEQQGVRLLHEALLATYEDRPEAARRAAAELAALAEGIGAACLQQDGLALAGCAGDGACAVEAAAVRARAELDRLVFTLRQHALN